MPWTAPASAAVTTPAPNADNPIAVETPDATLGFKLALDHMLLERSAQRRAGDRPTAAIAAAAAPVPARPSTAARAAPTASATVAGAGTAGTGLTTTTVPVAGMTCRSCEVRIEKYVRRLPNVRHVAASAIHGRVEIQAMAPVPAAAIERAINAAGYEIGRTPWLERDVTVWFTALSGLVLVAALAMLAQLTGLTGLAAGAGDLANGGLVVALLLGLAAGVSTCMALVGGLVLALSAGFQARRAATGSAGRAATGSVGDGLLPQMRPAAVFMTGRIVGYGVLGAALGAIGASVTMPPQLTAALMIGVAVVMTILGTRLTGLSPRIATWSPTLPTGLSRSLGLHDGAVGGYSDGRAAALGAASFFLPCGFTQAVQIYALSTGSPLYAGALMAVFAIGTAPGLMALAGLPVVVPSTMRPTLLRLVGVVVLGFAFVNASAGLRLAGISFSQPGVQPVAAAAPPVGAAPDGTQTLTTYQDGDGYSPPNVSIFAGIPTRWIVKSSTTSTCAAFLVVPGLGKQVRLHQGDNQIDLPALPVGTLSYSCAMGMYGGQITVVDRPAGATGGAPAGG
jgi:sulfite exporter TauE/SafE/copper chaperone CopZ